MREELIVGTGNPAKKQMLRDALAPLGLTVRGTDELGIVLDIEEDGATVLENARKKAQAYSQALQRPVLSMDSALYLEGLPEDEQPGVNTRRVPHHTNRATDEELLEYYSETIKGLGGRTNGYWEFALCLTGPDGQSFEKTMRMYRLFVSEPSPKKIPGYPLESIQIEPRTGKYISEMSEAEQAAFWQEVVGHELCDFVRTALASEPETA